MSVKRLTDMLQPLVEDLGYEFVGLEYTGQSKNAVLRIYIDHKQGIDLDDCGRVSGEVAALLDVEDPISGQYNLEVSSPGLDRPLFTLEQCARFAGEQVQMTVFAPVEGRRKFKGRILSVTGDTLNIDQDGAEIALDFSNIAKARLVPDYDSLMSGQNDKA
ncbi:MAG: ribosome maturation factor RimP [Lysobacterales bacterium]|jgi:ribosome maturation factor RimP